MVSVDKMGSDTLHPHHKYSYWFILLWYEKMKNAKIIALGRGVILIRDIIVTFVVFCRLKSSRDDVSPTILKKDGRKGEVSGDSIKFDS